MPSEQAKREIPNFAAQSLIRCEGAGPGTTLTTGKLGFMRDTSSYSEVDPDLRWLGITKNFLHNKPLPPKR
jgi:Na+-transporting NADH:ubiquinone oxidoreductase subunit NqrE